MSDNQTTHETIAEAFGRTTDPLAEYDARFKDLDVDPFDLWLEEQVYSQDYSDGTVKTMERRINQWRDYMTGHHDRHAAVPTTRHVMDFARYYLDERDNAKKTVAAKLGPSAGRSGTSRVNPRSRTRPTSTRSTPQRGKLT